jgi:hypothetical protein
VVNRRVVLDTQGPLLYIGQMTAFDDHGYWLVDADVHNSDDGHASKEEYVNEAHELDRRGTRHINRRRVFVERQAIVSISALDDVVTEGIAEDQGSFLP